ncbi:MAG: PhnD/SsuA/transferrin family substrate-binding protein [Phycisphaerae bacterium]|nr:PhnD/SsuA/transferrin family substrate-binding protein [Phycisphaerae bacterium]
MMTNWKRAVWAVLLVPFILPGIWLCRLDRGLDVQLGVRRGEPLQVVIMDPQCGRLARDDLKDPHRDYAPLGRFLEETLNRQVELFYDRHLREIPQLKLPPDLIIGPYSVVLDEGVQANELVRPIARLTDDRGSTELSGLFVVRADDPAKTIGHLADHKIVFGPPADEERHSWALAALSQAGITPVPPLEVTPSCRDALQAVTRHKADAAVISSYALALVDSETAAGQGAFRVVGRTASQPFITAFVAGRMGPATEQVVADALLSVQAHPQLLEALRSKAGFVPLQDKPAPKEEPPAPARPDFSEPSRAAAPWTDWRGLGRAGMSPDVPARLPSTARFLWRRGLTGPGLSGVAATATHVIVADKSEEKDQDIWHCLDAETGKELWTVAYATPKQMEFTNAPRAAPVIHEDFVYLLGAFGDLHCVNLYGSGVVWRRNIIKDFDAKLPTWGTCSAPLVVGDSLVVNPGAAEASLVALGLYTGEVIWKTPGGSPAYGSLILGAFGGIRQIVGYDASSLGGWDPNTGRRLWTLVPEKKGDYNVPTPINVLGRLLVATENNGTRLHKFDPNGQIRLVPVDQTRDLAPDTSTPVVVDGLVFGCFHRLLCLDLNGGLKTLYAAERDGAFKEHAALIAGSGRVLAVTVGGELILFRAARDAFTPIGRLRVFKDTEVWSHPALVGNHLYIRSMNEICCILLSE